MKQMLKNRWILLGLWIVLTVLFAFNQPNLKQILNEKGETTIPDTVPSQVASQMLSKLGNAKGESVLIVFNSPSALTNTELKSIETAVNKLHDQKSSLGINSIVDPFYTPQAKDQLISEDQTSMIVSVSFDKGSRDNHTVIKDFESTLTDVTVKHYLTGAIAINNDYVSDVAKGVEKSGMITILFILLVLVLMFRSVVTPVVSLMAVGVSYVASMSIIGILVTKFNFPVNNFTQMFVILVLFGIGTDYHILLFNRFKEELGNGKDIDEAIVTSFKTAGKTIIYSGLTVFMGFASLTFVKFPVYRSANAVAIGIAVLLIEMMTLTPVLMKIMGKKLFWPSKQAAGHKESGFWGGAASLSVKYPIRALLMVAVLIVPVILFSPVKLSFDNIKDLSPNSPSVQGFNLVAEKFGAGKVMQTTVVIESKTPMDSNEALAAIDELTFKLKGLEGVKEVAGPTQPKGEPIEKLYTSDQTLTVAEGLGKAGDGVTQVQDGLKKISDNLTTPDFSDVKKLSEGMGAIEGGMSAVTDGLQKVSVGGKQTATGAKQLAEGVKSLKAGVTSLHSGIVTINEKLAQIEGGYKALGDGYKALPSTLGQLKQLTQAMQLSLAKIDSKLPNDSDVATLKAQINQLSAGIDQLSSGMTKANANYDALTNGLTQLRSGLGQMADSTSETSALVQGINGLESGSAALADGLVKSSQGQSQLADSMVKLTATAGQVKDGQLALYDGLSKLGSGMTQLKDGIDKSGEGLGSISEGIEKSSTFLTEMSHVGSFNLPAEAKGSEDVKKMLDTYMSEDRKVAKLTVTLADEPYAPDSIDLIDQMDTLVKNQIKGTALKEAKVGIAGATAISNDLRTIALHDITFTQMIVLGAIFVLLLVVVRSFWTSVFIIGSLVATYYTALSATAFIAKQLFSSAAAGLSWNVPFFSFVMIAALGVDYSIFLMERYKEHRELSAGAAIAHAARHIGGVVMSAAVILAGTFATMYPSNIIVLMELAICVVIGLFLLAFVLLPIGLPALISLTEKVSREQSQHGSEVNL